MQTHIWRVWDRSREFGHNAIQFSYSAEIGIKPNKYARTERFAFGSRLWVDFNQGRFIFSDGPEKGNWELCSINGDLYKDEDIELFPLNDAFSCSIVLQHLSPKKLVKSWEYDSNKAKLLFRDKQGQILHNNLAVQLILDYHELQDVQDGLTKEREKIRNAIVGSFY